MKDNQALYATKLFNEWANKDGLRTEEEFFITKYLAKEGRTLDAGTGGGRIALGMQQLGFGSLHGFDYVPELIAQAKRRDTSHQIAFEVQDATKLSYPDASFDQIVYLQQVLCILETDADRMQSVREAARILKPKGVALFSFLSFEGRRAKYWPYIRYLQALRAVCRSRRRIQYLPWLKHDGKFNFGSLVDRGPYIYWLQSREAWQSLEEGGFRVVAAATFHQGTPIKVLDSCAELEAERKGDGLYFVCTKD